MKKKHEIKELKKQWNMKVILFTQHLRSGRIWHKVNFFKQSLTGLNSEFSFSKAEDPSLPYFLSISGGTIIGFILFPRVLVLCEMLSVLSRNWTRIAVSISCDDNHYTTGTSMKVMVILVVIGALGTVFSCLEKKIKIIWILRKVLET